MIIADLSQIAGRTYPARRRTQNLVGGLSPIQATHFAMGNVTLEPNGGQVPWHNQEQEEVYFIVEGEGEMCLGSERVAVKSGQAVYIPSGVFHQLTNTGPTPMRMIYVYGPAGDVAHWRQELEGTLPKAGIDVPALPPGAHPQCTDKPGEKPFHAKDAKSDKVWDEESLAKAALDASFAIHTELGPGLLESVYETVLASRLGAQGIRC
jgi:mannose-6-phosphate isomerase-like protein (cupin superfamily)